MINNTLALTNYSRHPGFSLAQNITRAASQQTYYTVRFLVDRQLVPNAYRAYAYFRWVDDHLDGGHLTRSECLEFISRQSALIDSGYRAQPTPGLSPHENMLWELVRSDPDPNSGLQTYIRNMLAVMVFDANRRGRLISQAELAYYTNCLSVAVTEALYYFIGHYSLTPFGQARYFAVTAAHITHMLRDTLTDIQSGYFNIPREYLDASHISPFDIESEPHRQWVQSRVQLAQGYFRAGRLYLAQVPNFRCRLAGYSYIARFEGTLRALARANFFLLPETSQTPGWPMGLRAALPAISAALVYRRPTVVSAFSPDRLGELTKS